MEPGLQIEEASLAAELPPATSESVTPDAGDEASEGIVAAPAAEAEQRLTKDDDDLEGAQPQRPKVAEVAPLNTSSDSVQQQQQGQSSEDVQTDSLSTQDATSLDDAAAAAAEAESTAKDHEDSERRDDDSENDDDDGELGDGVEGLVEGILLNDSLLRPKRVSRLTSSDKPPEDPKYSFLFDPERDGKADDGKSRSKSHSAAGGSWKDNKKQGRFSEKDPSDNEQGDKKDRGKSDKGSGYNGKRLSRIPSARRGATSTATRGASGGSRQVPAEGDLRWKLEARRSHEDPAGERVRHGQQQQQQKPHSFHQRPPIRLRFNGQDNDRYGVGFEFPYSGANGGSGRDLESRRTPFNRNGRHRNSYPAPNQRYRGYLQGPDDDTKWGHSKYFELYGGEPRPPRGAGRGGRITGVFYQRSGEDGGYPRDRDNNSGGSGGGHNHGAGNSYNTGSSEHNYRANNKNNNNHNKDGGRTGNGRGDGHTKKAHDITYGSGRVASNNNTNETNTCKSSNSNDNNNSNNSNGNNNNNNKNRPNHYAKNYHSNDGSKHRDGNSDRKNYGTEQSQQSQDQQQQFQKADGDRRVFRNGSFGRGSFRARGSFRRQLGDTENSNEGSAAGVAVNVNDNCNMTTANNTKSSSSSSSRKNNNYNNNNDNGSSNNNNKPHRIHYNQHHGQHQNDTNGTHNRDRNETHYRDDIKKPHRRQQPAANISAFRGPPARAPTHHTQVPVVAVN